jgi:hypothetical protein
LPIALKVAVVDPAATVMEAGTPTRVESETSSIVAPPVGAGLLRLAVQLMVRSSQISPSAQEMEARRAGIEITPPPGTITLLMDLPPALAETVPNIVTVERSWEEMIVWSDT